MNAAFLMVTTACFAGAAPPPAAPAPIPAPAPAQVVSAPVAGCSSCGGGCGDTCGCDTCGSGWRERLHGLFHRHGGCGCETGCDTCGGGFSGHFARFHGSSCGCETNSCGCDTCGGGLGFRERLGGLFHRHHDCGCETGCGCGTEGGCSSCGGGAGLAPAPANSIPHAEPIPAPKGAAPPKQMPNAPAPPVNKSAALSVEPEGNNPF